MGNFKTFSVFLNMVESHLNQITSSWETTLTEDINLWKSFVYSSPIKLSIRKTSFFCGEIMNVPESIGSTGSMMSAVVASQSRCGSNFATLLIVCLAVPSLTIRLFACTGVYLPNYRKWNKLPTLLVHVMSPILACYAIFSGQIQIQVLR